MRLRRLWVMRPEEMAGRGKQQAAMLVDRLVMATRAGSRARLRGQGPAAPGEFTLTEQFFPGAAREEVVPALVDRFPSLREQVLEAAASIQRGRFDLLGHRGLSFGRPVDWHLDPISGRRAPMLHWSRIDTLDAGVAGDVKVIWELNRHQWLVPLGQAYRFTGDERHAEAAARYLLEWMAANPPGLGVNWASSLELAFRLISWCWASLLMRGSRHWSRWFLDRLGASIAAHARHIARYLSRHSSPNTHLTGEALGLLYASLVLPRMRRATRWGDLGRLILDAEIVRQLLPDGVYVEQSACYQRYTIDIYLHYLLLASNHRAKIPLELAASVQRSLDFLLAIRRPDGSIPEIGDSDGGSTLPLHQRRAGDARGTFALAAVLFKRGDYAWAAGGATPEIAWMLGPRALETFDAIDAAPPPAAPSRLFAQGGWAVMSDGWAPGSNQALFDVGPLGCPLSGAHGHADLLGLQITASGVPCVVDPGTYAYTIDPEWRDHFRDTGAHSTVLVDGVGQAVPAGPFAWESRPAAKLREWRSRDELDYADAEHAAYSSLLDPVTHRRRVLFVKRRFWIVVDDVTGRATHFVEVRWQFARMPVVAGKDGWVRALAPGDRALLVRAFSSTPLGLQITEGQSSPKKGWISTSHRRRAPAPLLVHAVCARLPVRVVTFLQPADGAATPPVLRPLGETGGLLSGLAIEETGETLRIDDNDVTLGRG